MSRKTTIAIILCAGIAAGACVSEEVTPDEELAEGEAALIAGDRLTEPRFDRDAVLVSAVQWGLSWDARRESNAWNWYWNWQGGMSQWDFSWYSGQGYPNGTCPNYSWGNRCNSSRDTFFITPGWGANFQWYWGQPDPAGWSTLGQHPYWCPNTGGTWQGWSTTGHC